MNQSFNLEAATAAFFASGGQLVVVEGFTYQPLPQRKHPEPNPSRAKTAVHAKAHPQQSRAKARTEQISELAKTMTCGEVAKLLGETKTALWGVAARGGFRFFSPPKAEKPVKDTSAQLKADQALADQIIALRDAGAARSRVTATLGIGNLFFVKQKAAYEINFPLQRYRG